jgi:hypothetical protein
VKLVQCYQAYYSPDQIKNLDSSFEPFDTSNSPYTELHEIPHYFKLLDSGVCKKAKYTGLMSHKFNAKTHISGTNFFRFIEENPGYDVYFINPYPQNAYYSYNVWEQGELYHPGMIELADQLFAAAGVSLSASSAGRMGPESLLYCNYWVASQEFWQVYIELLRKLLGAIDAMPVVQRKAYSRLTNYVRPCQMLPFIFERVFSTFIQDHKDFKCLAYEYESTSIIENCLHPIESVLYENNKDFVDAWDVNNSWGEEQRHIIQGLNCANKAYYDLYFSHHEFPF